MDAESEVPRLGFDGRPIQDGEMDHSVEEGKRAPCDGDAERGRGGDLYSCAESACLLYSARIGLASVHNPDASAPDPLTVKWQDVPLGASGISLSSFGGRLACDRIEGPLLYAGTMCGPPQPLQRHSFKGSVLLAIRGECTFAAKARHAHAAGAAALLVFDAEAAPARTRRRPPMATITCRSPWQATPRAGCPSSSLGSRASRGRRSVTFSRSPSSSRLPTRSGQSRRTQAMRSWPRSLAVRPASRRLSSRSKGWRLSYRWTKRRMAMQVRTRRPHGASCHPRPSRAAAEVATMTKTWSWMRHSVDKCM